MPHRLVRVDNIALVSYLRMQEVFPVATRWEGKSCNWYFEETITFLEHHSAFFDTACVIPARFAVVMSQVKTEMYSIKPGNREEKGR